MEIGSRTQRVPRVRSTQKLPRVFDLAAGDAADEGDGEGDADGGGPEVVRGEAEHLGEIAHRGLGRVGLPVGVGGEGDGGVEGEVGRDRRRGAAD